VKRPTDAQARAIALIVDQDAPAYWPHVLGGGPVTDRYRTSKPDIYRKYEGRYSDGRRYTARHAIALGKRMPRTATFLACVREGWLTLSEHRVDARPDPPQIIMEVEATELGELVLAAWRQRQAAAAPPVLDDTGRAVLDLIARAGAAGFVVVPRSNEARAVVRALTRDGWVERGWTGPGERTALATAAGEVESSPEAADLPIPKLASDERAF